MSVSDSRIPSTSRIVRIAYLFMVVLSFYLVFVSRSGETHNVWEVMHPALLPVFFATTFLLSIVISTTEKVEYKLVFTILHSILIHSLIVVILPWGLPGDSRANIDASLRVFQSRYLHGVFGPISGSLPYQIYIYFRGDQFQAALSVIFARMFGVDPSWTSLSLVPLLWGTFVPLVAFLVTEKLYKRENISVLSGLVASAFPGLVIWGAVSVNNGIGLVLFFCALYFMLRYLSSGGAEAFFFMMVFSAGSFVGHYLVGAVSFSLIPLVLTLRTYRSERHKALAKFAPLLGVILGLTFLPFALQLQPFFYPIRPSYFGLDKLDGLPTVDIVWLALLGELVNFDTKTAIIYGLGQILGFLGMIRHLGGIKKGSDGNRYVCRLFLLLGFLITLANYRIMKLFVVGVPFGEERLWLFGDFIAVPFVALVVGEAFDFLRKETVENMSKLSHSSIRAALKTNLRSMATFVIVSILLSSWVMGSVYYAYPRSSSNLATTWYELEAVDYIDTTTEGRYVVICDQWFIYAAETRFGLYNQRAYYFHRSAADLNKLLNEMLKAPSTGPMIEAMKYNDADVAYFVVEEPRIKTPGMFDEVVLKASLALKTYAILGEGKLYIFYYEKTS